MKDEVQSLIVQRIQRLSPQNCSKSPQIELSHLFRAAQARPSPHIRRLRKSPDPLRANATPTRSQVRIKTSVSTLRSGSQRTLVSEMRVHEAPSPGNVLNTPTFRHQTPATRSVERLLTLCDSFHDLPKASNSALEAPNPLTALSSYISLLHQVPGKRFFMRNRPGNAREMTELRTGCDPATLQESIKAKSSESILVYRGLGRRTLWRIDSRRLLRSTERLLVRSGR